MSWESAHLGELIESVIGGDWGKAPEAVDDDYVDVACIRGTELKNWHRGRGETAALRRVKKSSLIKRQLAIGDIILEVSGGGPEQPVGRVELIDRAALATNPGYPKICTNFFRKLTPVNSIHSAFLVHFLKYFYATGEIKKYQAGSNNLRNLKFGEYEKIEVPLPPLNEQRRIVEKIETLFARLDKGEEALRAVQKLLARYRQSVLKAAVTGELTADWRTENAHRLEHGRDLLDRILKTRREIWSGRGKYTEPVAPDISDLPELPEGWVWASTEQLAFIETGATPKKGNRAYYLDYGFPWITSTAVNESLITTPQAYISEVALKETNAKVFPAGTLIVALYGEGKTRGKISELGIDAATNQACGALLVGHLPGSVKGFLRRFYEYNYEAIRAFSSGGVQPNLNLGIVKATSIPVPPEEEQVEILDRLNAVSQRIEILEDICKRELLRSSTLRQSILKDAFSGRLVDQDPSDEPAGELLARIRAAQPTAKKTRRGKASA